MNEAKRGEVCQWLIKRIAAAFVSVVVLPSDLNL